MAKCWVLEKVTSVFEIITNTAQVETKNQGFTSKETLLLKAVVLTADGKEVEVWNDLSRFNLCYGQDKRSQVFPRPSMHPSATRWNCLCVKTTFRLADLNCRWLKLHPFLPHLCQSPDSPFVLTATSTFSLSRARALKDSEEDCARSVCTLLSQRGRPEQINITHHTGAELSRKNIPHTFTTEILQCALRYERGKEHYGGQRTHHIHVHLAEKIPAKLPAFQDTEKRILGPKPQYFLIIPT